MNEVNEVNEYYAKYTESNKERAADMSGLSFSGVLEKRTDLVAEYAWAVPNDRAIKAIAALSPIIEVGAGTGYWASLIAQAGGTITAYDIAPPTGEKENTYRHKKEYFPVRPMSELAWATTTHATLMLCWPPYADAMAWNCLGKFQGDTLVYIGEGDGGCTGDAAFHGALDTDWTVKRRIVLPQWWGIHDALYIYTRKTVM